MPSPDTPEFIVARWLAQNGYEKTLSSFLTEAGLPSDAGSSFAGQLTLERVLEEKRLYDKSLVYEKRNNDENKPRIWTLPAPSLPQILDIPTPSNILNVAVDVVYDDLNGSDAEDVLSFTMADRKVIQANVTDEMKELKAILTQDSPVLSWIRVPDSTEQWIGTTMSGQVFVHTIEHTGYRSVSTISRTDHNRYCVKAALDTSSPDRWLLATIGWDAILNIYYIKNEGRGYPIETLNEPASTLLLDSIPEDILWLKHPDHDPRRPDSPPQSILLLTRRSSSFLYYYAPTSPFITLLGTQNLAPHASSWNTLTPTSLALCPTDTNLLAIAVPAVPHLKLIIVRLLIPEDKRQVASSSTSQSNDPEAHTAYARAALAKANTEEAAVELHVSTGAPQTPYSTPKVVWRPDGSGVWVNGDDGCVRGIERATGKVVATLLAGHEPASKIRTLWTGTIGGHDDGDGSSETELVVSGGFDKRVVIWRVKKDM